MIQNLATPLKLENRLAGQRQTLLFSATFPKEIQRLAADFMHDYIFLSVGRVGSSTDLIVQHVEYISPNEKRNVLLDLIGTVEVGPPVSHCGMACCSLKENTESLGKAYPNEGILWGFTYVCGAGGYEAGVT